MAARPCLNVESFAVRFRGGVPRGAINVYLFGVFAQGGLCTDTALGIGRGNRNGWWGLPLPPR